MNEQISTVGDYVSTFEAFIPAHPTTVSIALAFIISWGLTAAVASLMRALFPDNIERAVIRLFDIVVATIVAVFTWPGDRAVWWALAIGVSSPFGYLALSELLCWWKPGLKKYLSLRELAPDEPATGDDTRIPPGDSQ